MVISAISSDWKRMKWSVAGEGNGAGGKIGKEDRER
jgi:hypothetical protein